MKAAEKAQVRTREWENGVGPHTVSLIELVGQKIGLAAQRHLSMSALL